MSNKEQSSKVYPGPGDVSRLRSLAVQGMALYLKAEAMLYEQEGMDSLWDLFGDPKEVFILMADVRAELLLVDQRVEEAHQALHQTEPDKGLQRRRLEDQALEVAQVAVRGLPAYPEGEWAHKKQLIDWAFMMDLHELVEPAYLRRWPQSETPEEPQAYGP